MRRIWGPTWLRELHLEIDSVEQMGGELLVTGSYRWWSKYRVSLKPETHAVEGVENQLDDLVRE